MSTPYLLLDLEEENHPYVGHMLMDIPEWHYESLQNRLDDELTSLHIEEMTGLQALDLAIKYLADGTNIPLLVQEYRIREERLLKIIYSVLDVIKTSNLVWDRLYTEEGKWRRIERGMMRRYGIPNCVGALGAFRVKAKTNEKFLWMPVKKTVTFFGVADSYENIIMYETLVDSLEFRHTDIYKNIVMGNLNLPGSDFSYGCSLGPKVFVASENFPQMRHLCVPYPRVAADLNSQMFHYNLHLDYAKRNIDMAFHALTKIFRIMKNFHVVHIQDADTVFKACVKLHNFIMSRRMVFSVVDTRAVFSFEELPLIKVSTGREITFGAEDGRRALTSYFGMHIAS